MEAVRRELLGTLPEQALLRIVTENARVGLVIVDSARRYVYANSTYGEILGLEPRELVGQRLQDVLGMAYDERIRPYLDRAFAGERVAYELRYPSSDGDRYLSVRYEPTVTEEGTSFVVAVITDITERMRADEERHFQHAMLMTERALTLDGILVVDGKSNILSYNARFAEMWGVSNDLLHARADALVLASVIDKLARPDEFMTRVQYLYEHKDESSEDEVELVDGRVFQRHSAPIRNADGHYYGRVWYFRDITEQRRAVAELRLERDRAQRYLDAADVVLLALDTQWRVTLVNRKGCDTLGWTEQELLGRDYIATCLPPHVHEKTMRRLNSLKPGDTWTSENSVITKAGVERLFEWRNIVLLDDAGNVSGTLSSGTDITERRILEAQFHQAQKMEAIGRLAGGVAHDFNNLLTVILGHCELLISSVGNNDPRRADIDAIRTSGESAAALTRQLLAFSRKEIIEPAILDLNEVVGATRGLVERLIGEDIKVVVQLGDGLPALSTDRGQLEQVVMNLAVNARDAMPNGGTLTLETSVVDLDEHYVDTHFSVTPGRYVALTVTDTGIGMSPDVQARLFEPFFTTKEVGKGTGLGLATIHGIVARSGGSVGVYSELGKGTAFKVYFPAIGERIASVVTRPAARRDSGQETILVVEDTNDLRTMAKRLLERKGYTVLLAANTTEASEVFERNESIDVILTDVIMPGGSGPELISRLTAQRPSLKVIYMSGYTADAISHHGVLDPDIAFINKPFTSETLGLKVREVLDRPPA